jgi:hypothetical protein
MAANCDHDIDPWRDSIPGLHILAIVYIERRHIGKIVSAAADLEMQRR